MENIEKCELCPRCCGVDRRIKRGFCGVSNLRISASKKHYGEEPIISGNNGSGTIFFSGCSLRCAFCQNYDVSQHSKGVDISPRDLADIMRRLEGEGAHNINLVTPTHYVYDILRAMEIYKPNIPVCYNTSSYDRVETIRLLQGYVDIFLADYKYKDSELAKKLSSAEDYPKVANDAILTMREQVPEDVIVDGIMQKGLIIRHLVLPNQLANTKAVIDWVADNLGTNTWMSLMSQYTPFGRTKEMAGFDRRLKPIEYKIVVNYALDKGMDNVFVQDLASGTEEYIPEFYGVKLC